MRLVLREITEHDADDIFEYSSSLNVGPNAGWKPHESREETLDVMKSIFLDQEGIWGIVLRESGKLIGSIGLVKDPKRENEKTRMLGYALSDRHWGKGFMTQAVNAVLKYGFDELKLDLISAYCYPFNQRSKNVLKKCGFSYEGILKLAERIYDDSVYDNECYALTAQDYAAHREEH
jgi:putative acetyltransferase